MLKITYHLKSVTISFLLYTLQFIYAILAHLYQIPMLFFYNSTTFIQVILSIDPVSLFEITTLLGFIQAILSMLYSDLILSCISLPNLVFYLSNSGLLAFSFEWLFIFTI